MREDWAEIARPAYESPNHVSTDRRWLVKARAANPGLSDEQAARLAAHLKTEHYRRMQRASVQARAANRELAELAAEYGDDGPTGAG